MRVVRAMDVSTLAQHSPDGCAGISDGLRQLCASWQEALRVSHEHEPDLFSQATASPRSALESKFSRDCTPWSSMSSATTVAVFCGASDPENGVQGATRRSDEPEVALADGKAEWGAEDNTLCSSGDAARPGHDAIDAFEYHRYEAVDLPWPSSTMREPDLLEEDDGSDLAFLLD